VVSAPSVGDGVAVAAGVVEDVRFHRILVGKVDAP
jgi:hypothetical protein